MSASSCRSAKCMWSWVFLIVIALALTACARPPSTTVRDGADPFEVDKDVAFRTTYYFRVFDYCVARKLRKPGGIRDVIVPLTDSLYRFRMTGKSHTLFSDVKFESGTLKAWEIDPFGAKVEFDGKSGRFRAISPSEVTEDARRGAILEDLEEMLSLRRQILGLDPNDYSRNEGFETDLNQLIEQHLSRLGTTGVAPGRGGEALYELYDLGTEVDPSELLRVSTADAMAQLFPTVPRSVIDQVVELRFGSETVEDADIKRPGFIERAVRSVLREEHVNPNETVPPADEAPGETEPPADEAPGETEPPADEAPGETEPQADEAPGETEPQADEAPGETEPPADEAPGETEPPADEAPGETEPPADEAPGETEPQADEAPGETEPPADEAPGETEPPADEAPGETEPPADVMKEFKLLAGPLPEEQRYQNAPEALSRIETNFISQYSRAGVDAPPIQCPEDAPVRRGFQVLGPEGWRTFDQDERLVLAMSSSAQPLVATLQELSSRVLQARDNPEAELLPIALEQKRLSETHRALYVEQRTQEIKPKMLAVSVCQSLLANVEQRTVVCGNASSE